MKFTLSLLITIIGLTLSAQRIILPLWSSQVPNQTKTEEKETQKLTNVLRIANVQNPTIEVHLPSKKQATGQAMLICPGGGYSILAYDLEGTDIAKLLNAHGIAGIVLKYRLPKSKSNIIPHKSALMDAQEAMKIVRANASKWNIDPDHIGVIGFSAGGHLASTLGTHFDEASRPNFMALIYPVISMDTTITHLGSRKNLLGKNPTKELVKLFSNELQVKPNTPSTFLLHTTDDQTVPVENSLRMYEALKRNNIPTELHIYPKGGHGYGLARDKEYLSGWSERLIDWLKGM